MKINPGQILGAYEVLSFLGEGAMGSVHRARDERLGRQVALKILHPELTANANVLKRFQREAHSASALNHPNIVTIYEIGEVDGTHFIAMEYVEGERLRDLMDREQMSLKSILRVASGIGEGLAEAHAKGVVHRDLKPENIMIASNGFVKILDFGLAKLYQPESDVISDENQQTLRLPSEQTAHGTVVGTPSYMAPEQVAAERVDHRADQFSFGAILFEMLTRQRPFDRRTRAETMTAILREPPPRLRDLVSDVPVEIERMVNRCLSKKSAERYSATADLTRDVRDLHESFSMEPDITPHPRARSRPRARKLAAMILTVVIILTLGGILATLRDRVLPDAPEISTVQASQLPKNLYLVVVPFESFSNDQEAGFFASGIAEAISIRLGTIPGIQVIPPNAVGDSIDDIGRIARDLGANLVLRGSLRRSGENLRINYMVMNPETGVQLAGGTINGSARDPFLLEDRLADSIIGDLELELGEGPTHATNQGLLDAGQQEQYLKALGALHRYDDEDSVDIAIALLENLYEEVPSSELVGAALGRAYAYKYQITHNTDWADQALDVSEAVLRRSPELEEAQVTHGEVLIQLGRHDDAILRFRQALSQHPDSAAAALGMAEAMTRAGRYEEAAKAYAKAISLRPAYPGNYIKLGVSHYRQGHLDEAIRQFEKALELSPDNTRAASNLGAIQMNAGRFQDASETLTRLLRIAETGSAWSNFGTTLYYLGRFEEAADAFERATLSTPDDYKYWMNLADAYRWGPEPDRSKAMDTYQRAITMAREVINREPSNAHAHASLGAMYVKTGREELAREHVNRALSIPGAAPDDILLAGIALSLLGDADAHSVLARAVSAGLDPAVLESEPELSEIRQTSRWDEVISRADGRTETR